MSTLIKNGKIATSTDFFEGDIYIEDGMVKEIGTNLNKDCSNIIDAEGKIVVPGGVDVHTHFNLHVGDKVSCDDFYTGTIAAACGGTTSIIDHIGFGPKGCSLHHQINAYHSYADGNSVIDYSFHGVIQQVDNDILSEMECMVNIEGITSFKVYLTYDYRINDSDAYRVLKRLKELGGITAVHGENHEIIEYLKKSYINQGGTSPIYHALSRPPECEGEAVNRIIDIAYMADNAPLYIVHLTCEQALSHIIYVRNRDQVVLSETCPQYLLLDEERYKEQGIGGLKYVMSPPLRKRHHQEALWKGINYGYIQVIATDHCPFSIGKDKQSGMNDFTKCPNGAPGVEERIPLMFSEGVMKGRMGINKFVEVCCTNPAKIFGMYPQKGTIAPGSDGDIVIIDPDRQVTLTKNMLHSNADYTAYEGFKLKGYPVMTLVRGEITARENEFTGTRGFGKFIKRKLGPKTN